MYSLRKSIELVPPVPSEGPTVDGFVSLILVIGGIFLRFGERRIVLDRFRASDQRLIFEGVEHFIDREFQRSEVFHWPVALKRAWQEDRELLLLVRRLSLGPVWSMVGSFASELPLPSIIAEFCGIIGGSLHCLF